MIFLPLYRLVCRPRRLLHVIPRPRRIFTRGAGVSAATKAAVMGGLVCAGLPFAALVAPDALGLPWRQERAPMHLVETAGPLDAVRAEILGNPPPMFAMEVSNSPPGSGAFLSSSLAPALWPSAGRDRPVSVPEPGGVIVFLAGVAGLVLARRIAA